MKGCLENELGDEPCSNLIDCCALRSADRHHLLGDTDAAAPHPDPQRVHPHVDQILSLRRCHHVAANNLYTNN